MQPGQHGPLRRSRLRDASRPSPTRSSAGCGTRESIAPDVRFQVSPAGAAQRDRRLLRGRGSVAGPLRRLRGGDPRRDRARSLEVDPRRRPRHPVGRRLGVRRHGDGREELLQVLAEADRRAEVPAPRRAARRALAGHPRRDPARLPLVLRHLGRLADDGDARPRRSASVCPTRPRSAPAGGSTTSTCPSCASPTTPSSRPSTTSTSATPRSSSASSTTRTASTTSAAAGISRASTSSGFGIASVCGYGRVEPELLPEILRVHAQDAEEL